MIKIGKLIIRIGDLFFSLFTIGIKIFDEICLEQFGILSTNGGICIKDFFLVVFEIVESKMCLSSLKILDFILNSNNLHV